MSETTTDAGTLTLSDLIALETIHRAVTGNRRVRWLPNGDLTAFDTAEGVARAFVRDNTGAAFLSSSDDVRDAYVWISGMFESFIPVRDVMQWVRNLVFVIDD